MPIWPGVSEPLEGAKFRYLSLGAGVQSSTLALMSAWGEIEPLDFAIFADTGDEPAKVYAWLDWLEAQLPYPVHRVRRPGLTLGELAVAVATGDRTLSGSPIPPWFLRDLDGRMSMNPKQCSKEFKTRVVTAKVREMLGLAPGQRGGSVRVVEQWIGISLDEMQRMKRAEAPWIASRFPLIEARMNRLDCLRWMEERQYPRPPKSSCVYCPFRGDDQWRDMRDNEPEDFVRACAMDEAIRPGWEGITGHTFVHRSGVPLAQVDLSSNSQPGMFDCDDACMT